MTIREPSVTGPPIRRDRLVDRSSMLHELRVENLLLMEQAELRLAGGLNVITGETGAGKTLLAHALDLLLGGKARAGIVREGAAEAYVEGVFAMPEGLPELAAERIPDGAEELVLARRVWPDGRTRAYVCGRAATLADLRELGSRLLAFYGQHEHRKLMLAAAQLDVLDSHIGPAQLELRGRTAAAHHRVRALQAQVNELRELAGARDRELDLVTFELGEIEAAAPTEEEVQQLTAERDRLRHLETLRGAAFGALEALAPESDGGAAELIAGAARQLEAGVDIDADLAGISQRLDALRYEAEDLAGELRDYLPGLEAEPARLEQVEERLALLARLERKHGGTIAEVLAHAERCRSRMAELEGAEVALEAEEAELERARAELDACAEELSAHRAQAAPALAEAVRVRLGELAMPDAKFEIELRPRADGCGPAGADTCEFLIAPNAGLAAGPLKEIASGGELSRVMLALLSVAQGRDGSVAQGRDAGIAQGHSRGGPSTQPLLVFDEIDAGIGGHTARAVGNHLRALADGRQVVCITHLPQVAAVGERHFAIVKDSQSTPARTLVRPLDGDQVVGELVRMLGAADGDRAASQHARQLLRAA